MLLRNVCQRPVGTTDRSLARSAWERDLRKNRPIGHGMIGRATPPEGFSSKFYYSNHRIWAHTCSDHTVPYGTILSWADFPGTSCQATIVRSLRDKQLPVSVVSVSRGNP